MAEFKRELELVEIGRVKFRVEWKVYKRSRRAFLVGFERKIKEAQASTSIYPPKVINPNNRSFFLATVELYDEGYLEEVAELFRRFGFNISLKELTENYEEAKRYAERKLEKWRRIKRAWGLGFFDNI